MLKPSSTKALCQGKSLEESVVLRVRLTPKGGRNALMRFDEGVLHARVAAPPVDGAANRALIELLADALKIPKSQICFHSGETAREKSLLIVGLGEETIRARIDAALAKHQVAGKRS